MQDNCPMCHEKLYLSKKTPQAGVEAAVPEEEEEEEEEEMGDTEDDDDSEDTVDSVTDSDD